MSKIICDVCGTAYQESAMQCPICGCVRPGNVTSEVEADEAVSVRSEKYTYVKGGRFSKANVQKRNQGILRDDTEQPADNDAVVAPKGNKSDRGLVIAVCALLFAIVAVVIYIAFHYFSPTDNNAEKPTNAQNATASQATVATTQPTVVIIPCSEITLSKTEITLTSESETYMLSVAIVPEDTTDELIYVSEDESVATVSDSGQITAVGAGETVVTVTCGEASAQCRVICSFDEVASDPITNPTIATGDYKAPFKINKTDVSIRVGETFQLKLLDANGEIIPVTWSATIADICTVEGNDVTGAEKGKTELSVTFAGEIFTCIVRVR